MSKLSDLLAAPSQAAGQPKSPVIPQAAQPASLPQQPQPTQQPAANPLAAALILPPKQQPATPADALGEFSIAITSAVDDWPGRTVGDGNTPLANELQRLLQQIQNTLNTDEITSAMDDCLRFIHDNPATKELLLPDDMGLITRALQTSYGVILAQKNERGNKRNERGKKVDETTRALADLGFGSLD